jgi:L-fuculose-phosphate aldolase
VPSEEQARADIVEIGRRLWERGYVASNDGNISVRLDERRLITTPKSVSKGFMTPDMMVVTDFEGRKLTGRRDPSSEIKMHLQVYRDRPDAGAVVHAHPPTATGFAVAGIPLDRAVLAEVVTTLGSIPIAEYATPSTDALPAACSKYLKAHDGLLLANHGALAIGPDLFTAYHRMETIEHFAKISLVTRMLGRENLLSREEVDRLQGLRGMYGIASPAPVCTDDTVTLGTRGQAECQVIQAPSAPAGTQLVVDPASRDRRLGGGFTGVVEQAVQVTRVPGRGVAGSGDGEIRLTYRELTALIEDAVRNLK